jgi:hypothetical protein
MNRPKEARPSLKNVLQRQFRLDPCSSLLREKVEVASVSSPVTTLSAHGVLCQAPRPKLVGILVEALELCPCPGIDLWVTLAAVGCYGASLMGPVRMVIKDQKIRTYSIEGSPGFNIIRLIGCMCHVAKESSRDD